MTLRRPARRFWIALATTMTLAVCVVAADWLARRTVERRIASALTSKLSTVPEVHVGGPSALLGLATDRFSSVTVATDRARVPVRGREMPLSFDVSARSVSGLVRGGDVRAGRVDGDVGLHWQDLERMSGTKLAYGGHGDIVASVNAPVLGETLPVVVTGRPGLAVDAQRLRVVDPTVTVDGLPVPADIVRGVLPRVESRLALPRLPGIRFTSVEAAEGGPVLRVGGREVSVRRP